MSQSTVESPVAGKIALVTGANRGIGKAIVETLLANGASKVYLAVRNPESAALLAQQYPDRVVTLQADLGSDVSIQALARSANDVDIVINNAGVLEIAKALDASAVQAMGHEININVYGLLRIAQAFAPVLEARKGVLVQLNSVASVVSFADFATYSASKAAAYSLTLALKESLAAKGVRVVSVHPGPIATEMGAKAGLAEVAEPPSVVAEAIISALAEGDFHVFPDTAAQQLYGAYRPYAEAANLA